VFAADIHPRLPMVDGTLFVVGRLFPRRAVRKPWNLFHGRPKCWADFEPFDASAALIIPINMPSIMRSTPRWRRKIRNMQVLIPQAGGALRNQIGRLKMAAARNGRSIEIFARNDNEHDDYKTCRS